MRLPTYSHLAWHGVQIVTKGDSCCDPKHLGNLTSTIESWLPGVYIHSIQIGKTEDEDRKASYFDNMNNQVDAVCEALSADPLLEGGFNAMGFSQGGHHSLK
jgi:palmitoyl-protein thioesterase